MYQFFDQVLYDTAIRLAYIPYHWGGDDPMEGFDCSGLVIELLQVAGVLPNKFDATAQGLFIRFEKGRYGVYTSSPRFGALVFFGNSVTKITHVAFCLDRYRMLEAGGGGRKIKTTQDAINYNAYTRIRAIDSKSDLVATLMPSYKSIGSIH